MEEDDKTKLELEIINLRIQELLIKKDYVQKKLNKKITNSNKLTYQKILNLINQYSEDTNDINVYDLNLKLKEMYNFSDFEFDSNLEILKRKGLIYEPRRGIIRRIN